MPDTTLNLGLILSRYNDQEHKDLGLKAEGDGRIAWSSEGKPKVVEIGPKAHMMIQDALRGLDRAKKLRLDQVALYERFVVQTKE
jgi:hypothetical protein